MEIISPIFEWAGKGLWWRYMFFGAFAGALLGLLIWFVKVQIKAEAKANTDPPIVRNSVEPMQKSNTPEPGTSKMSSNAPPQPTNSIGTITNNSGIVTQGQTGGTNIINQAPQPKLEILTKSPPQDQGDGTYLTVFVVEVSGLTGTLAIIPKSSNLAPYRRGFFIMPFGGGTVNSKYKDATKQIIVNPSGKYNVYVRTTTPGDADFDYQFGL